jgi:hypothetical protein
MRSRIGRLSVVLIAAALLPAAGAGAADASPGAQHCVIQVVGQSESGEFQTTPEQCYSTFAAAARASGIPGVEASDTPASLSEAQMAASWAIGIHYDGFSGTGATLTVNGSDCAGGWLNVSATWVNKISSTRNGCNRISHYSGTNLTGSVETTFGVNSLTNLSGLNNATDSIQYLN